MPPLVLRGRAHGPADPPWAAVLEALEPVLATRPRDGAPRAAATRRPADPARAAGAGGARGGAPGPRASALADPERRQPRALEALLRWLGRLAAERPVVLVLEDLHVADAATRAFATFVARIAREERIALVLSYQPDRLTREHPLRENLAVIDAGLRPPVRVDLAPLGAPRDRRRSSRASRASGRLRPSSCSSPSGRPARRSSSRSWSPPAASCATRR